MPRKRDFNPAALDPFAVECTKIFYESKRSIRGDGREFVVLLPRRLITRQGRYEICTGKDERLLRKMLVRHFKSLTADPYLVQGAGLRGKQFETNEHRKFTVVASRSAEALCYFRALCQELEDCSDEEQVFITYKDIVIL